MSAEQAPAQFAGQVLYAPLAPLLARFVHPGLPEPADLDASLAAATARPGTDGGQSVRFAAPADDTHGYEQRIHTTGVVATRPGSWHDFFNALVWSAFPRTKAALNARHVQAAADAAASPSGRRGPPRDAATQFDESGLIVASADPALPSLLAAHRWRELFWERRADVIASLGFFVFGHGLYDSLRTPFFGLCGKVVVVEVDRALLTAGPTEQVVQIDAMCAALWRDPARFRTPRELLPLPVLGIPGVTPENECAAYYEDERQFRRARFTRAG